MGSTEIRASKKKRIENFFFDNLNKEFSTMELHMMFGTSFRARVSDINKDDNAKVRIHNRLHKKVGSENSYYYATSRINVSQAA